jgi:hydrogenase/urease accessory protein HupE
MRRAVLTMLSAGFVVVPTIALAHTGHGGPSGLMQGLGHPITGIDHTLAMVAVLSFVGVLARAGLSIYCCSQRRSWIKSNHLSERAHERSRSS